MQHGNKNTCEHHVNSTFQVCLRLPCIAGGQDMFQNMWLHHVEQKVHITEHITGHCSQSQTPPEGQKWFCTCQLRPARKIQTTCDGLRRTKTHIAYSACPALISAHLQCLVVNTIIILIMIKNKKRETCLLHSVPRSPPGIVENNVHLAAGDGRNLSIT